MLANKALSRMLITIVLTLICSVLAASASTDMEGRVRQLAASPEPNVEIASTWWRELENIWTPIGWKDHVYRFNVLYDGSILVVPSRHLDRLEGRTGLQLTFRPCEVPGRIPKFWLGSDDFSVIQSWDDTPAPVLRSEWAWEGLILQQEVFAYLPGGREIETGLEPLFAWVRLSIKDTMEGVPLPENAGFGIKININHFGGLANRYEIHYPSERAKYRSNLISESDGYDSVKGYKLLEDGGYVRLGIAPRQQCSIDFLEGKPLKTDSLLRVVMKVNKGAHVDLLVPVLSVKKDVFDKVLAQGYDKALKDANRYWSAVPSTAAHVQVPEDYVNRAIERNSQFAQIIAERDPNTGYYSLLTGSLYYAGGTWATPMCVVLNRMDVLGYHSEVEKYLGVFKKEQGTVVPPGPGFEPHPGYLSVPKTLTKRDWLSDHGALLWLVSEHALLTRNESFIKEWLPVVIKACEWIQQSRGIEGHGGAAGVLPLGVATDRGKHNQAVWNDGWNFKGLVTAVRLLKAIDHPRAAEFDAEAREYKKAFIKAFREQTQKMPVWVDNRSGKQHRLLPYGVYGVEPWQFRDPFYLDTGPLFLVFSGLMDADDELMKSTLLWFREGPPVETYRSESTWHQVPCLDHELSSSEPCYSWNVFHSWQLGDRAKYLEGMYSLFTGAISRETYTLCERRGGYTGMTPCDWSAHMVRLAVIDDQIVEEELHLLRIMPLAWLRTDKEAVFENMPTYYGPVSLKVKLTDGGRTLRVNWTPSFRNTPQQVILHVPPVAGLSSVVLNGKSLNWDGERSILAIR